MHACIQTVHTVHACIQTTVHTYSTNIQYIPYKHKYSNTYVKHIQHIQYIHTANTYSPYMHTVHSYIQYIIHTVHRVTVNMAIRQP